MEKSAPIFSICINKRIAGVLNRKWDIVPIDESEEAKNQADIVKKMFVKSDLKNEDGLMEVLCGTKDKTYTEFKNTCIKNKDIKSFKIISNISDHRLDYYIDKYLPGNGQKLNRKYQK